MSPDGTPNAGPGTLPRPTAPTRPVAADLTSRIARLREEITELVGLDPAVDGATGPALHAELRTAAGQLHAFAARILARVEADGRWSAGPSRTFPDWVARRQLASTAAVRREVALGHALDESLPRTSVAVARGEVSVEHAEVLARVAASSETRRAALASESADRNEASLLERARRMPLDAYRREVDRWATQVDASAAESEHEAACAKEYLTLARRRDGVALQGFLTLENAEVLATALRAVAGVPSQGDTRSREERQAAALVDAGRLILDRGLSGGGQQVRPHLLVHVSAELLRAVETDADPDAAGPARFDGLAPAHLSDGSPIPPSSLARLICDGELSRVVFSAEGAVLDVGRAHRSYSGQQRLAVIARDMSCRFPGCGAPPVLGEVHHVTSWASGGPTSVANGVLLCWFHHGLVHRRGVRIRRSAGGWEFRREDGALIDEGRSPAPPAPPASSAAADPPDPPDPPGIVATAPPTAPSLFDDPCDDGPRPSAWGGPRRASQSDLPQQLRAARLTAGPGGSVPIDAAQACTGRTYARD